MWLMPWCFWLPKRPNLSTAMIWWSMEDRHNGLSKTKLLTRTSLTGGTIGGDIFELIFIFFLFQIICLYAGREVAKDKDFNLLWPQGEIEVLDNCMIFTLLDNEF
ncbi:hypothetical protein NL676_028894 [Syzygium grande]|nr:hypothetical protein NL676_028894 [Syzygium grande]